jgi:hypothetical protein
MQFQHRRPAILFLFGLFVIPVAGSQEVEETRPDAIPRTSVALSPVISSYQNDFGFGVEMISPNFAGGSLAVSAAEADKLDRSPVFANGFMTNVGVRYYF